MNTPCFCLLLHFLRVTKSDGKIVKSKSRTSERTHCSGRNPSCSDFCNAVDVIVMYHLELIFVLCQGYYKPGECSPYQTWMQRNTFGWINFGIIKDVQRNNAHTTEMNNSFPTKILPETWLDPQRTGNHWTSSNWLQYKYTAKIWKIKQQSFRGHCVSTAGTRLLSDTLSITRT